MPSNASALWQELRFRIAHDRRPLLRQFAHALRSRVWKQTEMWFYDYAAEDVARLPRSTVLRRDAVDDLLRYERHEPSQPTRDAFLAQARTRLASGQHAYTTTRDGRLIHYSWLIDREATSVDRVLGYQLHLPDESAYLYDSYTHESARGRGLYRGALLQMLHDAVEVAGARRAYCSVDVTNRASLGTLEKVGFRHVATMRASRAGLRVRRHAECLDARLSIAALPPGQ